MATLRTLECLVALVNEGSVTKAAAALHLSQPALSHHIAALEREIGTAVVERFSRGVRVTAAGRAMADKAREALAAAAGAIEVGRRTGVGGGGCLRIACAETMTTWLLAPVLRLWQTSRPEVQLDLAEFTSADRMQEHMIAGGVDIVVGPEPTVTKGHMEILGQEEMLVACSATHRFVSRPSVTVSELAGEPFVHYDPANGLSTWLDEFVASHDVALTTVLRTCSPRTAAHLAGDGVGVTVIPVSALAGANSAAVRSLEPPVHRDIVAITMAPSDALVRRFVADLRRRGLPRWRSSL